jgi:hypothetical protein
VTSIRALPLLIAAALVPAALVRAAEVPFTGTLTIQIGDASPISVPGSGVATVNGSGAAGPVTRLTIPPGIFSARTAIPVANALQLNLVLVALGDRFGNPISNQTIVLSQAGCTSNHPNVSCPGGGLNGFGGFAGSARLGFGVTPGYALANFSVPLSILGGGSTFQRSRGSISYWSGSGAGWTTGTARVFNPTATTVVFYAHVPATTHVFPTVTYVASQDVFVTETGTTRTLVGSATTRSGLATDTLSLVTPLQLFSPLGDFIPASARIQIHLVPEPGTLTLLGLGAGALLLGAQIRARHR